jgi:hypothetical protein
MAVTTDCTDATDVERIMKDEEMISIFESGKKERRKWGRGFLRSCFPH